MASVTLTLWSTLLAVKTNEHHSGKRKFDTWEVIYTPLGLSYGISQFWRSIMVDKNRIIIEGKYENILLA